MCMYVCLCVCVYIYIYICVCVCVWVCVCVCVYTHIPLRTDTSAHAHAHVHTPPPPPPPPPLGAYKNNWTIFLNLIFLKFKALKIANNCKHIYTFFYQTGLETTDSAICIAIRPQLGQATNRNSISGWEKKRFLFSNKRVASGPTKPPILLITLKFHKG